VILGLKKNDNLLPSVLIFEIGENLIPGEGKKNKLNKRGEMIDRANTKGKKKKYDCGGFPQGETNSSHKASKKRKERGVEKFNQRQKTLKMKKKQGEEEGKRASKSRTTITIYLEYQTKKRMNISRSQFRGVKEGNVGKKEKVGVEKSYEEGGGGVWDCVEW